MGFKYTVFSGCTYDLGVPPASVFGCTNHILFRFENVFKVISFNDSITFEKLDDGSFLISCPEGSTFSHSHYVAGSWGDTQNVNTLNVSHFFSIDGCSDNLLDYKDLLLSGSFSFPFQEDISTVYTLRPIIEEQNITPIDIFGEIFGILPVLLVVLVSFIGIRKGIKYLFELLRSS